MLLLVNGQRHKRAAGGTEIDASYSNTRSRKILTRSRFVVNGFRLLGGPFFAGGHDTGTLFI